MADRTISNAHTNTPLNIVLEALQAAAGQTFDTANPIPANVNHSVEFHAHEQRAVFGRGWICIGRHDELPRTGDFLTFDIAGTPVIILRHSDGNLRAFVNACAHRFACLTTAYSGSVKKFTCPYHAWTYNLSGALIRAPYMEMKEGFKSADHHLKQLHCEVWEGFVYVTLAETPEISLTVALAPFHDRTVGRFNMARYETVLRQEMTWNANWKNLIENFTESYHVPMAHKQTFALYKKPLEDYVCGEDSKHYGYHYAPTPVDADGKAQNGGIAHPENTTLTGEWRRLMVDFCIFPCHLVTVMPDFLWYISVIPQGVDRFHATWGVAIPSENLADIQPENFDTWLADLKDYMELANSEDKLLVEALHRGTSSGTLPPGTLHPLERNLWQFTRYLNRMCQNLPTN